MAKDAKGHGSEKRGGATPVQSENAPFVSRFAGKGVNYLEPNDPRGAGARARSGWGTDPTGPGSHTAAGVNKSGSVVPVTVSDAEAAKALAGGGAKSAPVDTHPSMGGKPVGQMKMSASDFAALRTAVTPHLATTADPSQSAMRQRWDAMHKSGFDTRPLYKAGLNDDQIDTALRRIQGR